MNIFDVGGLVTFTAVIITIILGTGIFMGLHKVFDIVHLGFGGMIGMWFGCCIVAAVIVNFLGGLVGGIFSIIWILLKVALIIFLIGFVGRYIYILNLRKKVSSLY